MEGGRNWIRSWDDGRDSRMLIVDSDWEDGGIGDGVA